MSFFHLKYANGQTQILNLDVRASILKDFIFRTLVLDKSVEYVQTKTATVAHTIEETRVNVEHITAVIATAVAAATPSTTENGETAAVPATTTTSLETIEDLKQKVIQLNELMTTFQAQHTALQEASEKLKGIAMNEIDVCSESGTALGLQELDSTSASDVLESRATYILCRIKTEQVVVLSFAVPEDGVVTLDSLLGPTRIKVTKKSQRPKSGSRTRRKQSVGKSVKGKGLKDVTNRRSQSSQ